MFWLGCAVRETIPTKQSEVPAASKTPDLNAQVETLIKKLSSEDWQTRESAQKQLIEIGEPALPMLEETEKNSPDIEVKTRIDRIKAILSPRCLFKKLSDPQQAESAFLELIAPAIKLGHNPFLKGYVKPLKFSSVTLIDCGQERTLAVVFLDWAGKVFVCGTGARNGGVSCPDLAKQGKTAESIIIIRDDGTPLLQIRKSRSNFVLMDADGDGKIQELVRWDNRCDYSRPPFLIIHDLTKENFPAMVNLQLNPEAGRESRETICVKQYTETVNPDGTISGGGGEYINRAKQEPDRHGAWKLEPLDKYQNIVIEENINGQIKKVATFTYDNQSRTWIGPAGSPEDFWIVEKDSAFRAHFTDLTKAP